MGHGSNACLVGSTAALNLFELFLLAIPTQMLRAIRSAGESQNTLGDRARPRVEEAKEYMSAVTFETKYKRGPIDCPSNPPPPRRLYVGTSIDTALYVLPNGRHTPINFGDRKRMGHTKGRKWLDTFTAVQRAPMKDSFLQSIFSPLRRLQPAHHFAKHSRQTTTTEKLPSFL